MLMTLYMYNIATPNSAFFADRLNEQEALMPTTMTVALSIKFEFVQRNLQLTCR